MMREPVELSIDGHNLHAFPLTHSQKRIWYNEKLYPKTALNNVGGTITVFGRIQVHILEKSIQLFIQKNDAIRLQCVEDGHQVYQYVKPYDECKIGCFDFTQSDDVETAFRFWVEEESCKGMDLINAPLFYFALYKLSENKYGYFVKLHHFIADGWAMNLMTDRISGYYSKLLAGESVSEEVEFSYVEYIDQESRYLNSGRFERDKVFWNEKLKTLPDCFLYKTGKGIEAWRKSFIIPQIDIEKFENIEGGIKFSLNTLFVSVMLIYLFRTKGVSDIILGTPVLNRSGIKEKNTVGMFVSTMPFRIIMHEDEAFSVLMKRVQKELKECYFHQKYPYDLLFQDLNLAQKGWRELFQVSVNYRDSSLSSQIGDFPVENSEFFNGYEVNAVHLGIKDGLLQGKLVLDFNCIKSCFSENDIEQMFKHIERIIEQVVSNPHVNIMNISLLDHSEIQQQILEFNCTAVDYPKEKSIITLFEEQAEKTPLKAAISLDGDLLTYSQLDKRANCLAQVLISKGVKPDTIVGLLTEHSFETFIGILAILKAGGAYLPIDPSYPAARITSILEDAQNSILLTNMELDKKIDFKGKVIQLQDESLYKGSGIRPGITNKPDHLAYVLYTSGSSGNPKGVMVQHQGLVNYIWWAGKTYISHENEVFAFYSSLAFDLTVTSVFTPLVFGNSIEVYRDRPGEEYVLYRIIKEGKVDIVKLTPSHLSLIKDMDNSLSSVKKFIVGGEDLRVSLAAEIHKSFKSRIEIFNEYGPTETVVGCMIYKYCYERDKGVSVPIGVPAHNVQIYILDSMKRPMPKGCTGEIYISGDGVAKGYWRSPHLTEERFMENPFVPGLRMYRSGDMGRFLEDGNIAYEGRADQQVKINGYRIELAEIEKNILHFEEVYEVVVTSRESSKGVFYLCAYIVPGKDTVTEDEIKAYLSKVLPEYMVPSYYVFLEYIPLTANGKVDTNQLPEPFGREADHADILPRNSAEEALALAVREVLKLENASMRDNFLALGGDSIRAIQVSAKLLERGFKLETANILSHPVLEDMALNISVKETAKKETGMKQGANSSGTASTKFDTIDLTQSDLDELFS